MLQSQFNLKDGNTSKRQSDRTKPDWTGLESSSNPVSQYKMRMEPLRTYLTCIDLSQVTDFVRNLNFPDTHFKSL